MFRITPAVGKPYYDSIIAPTAEVARRAVTLDGGDMVTEKSLSEFERKLRLGTTKQVLKPEEKAVLFRGLSGFLEHNSARNPADALRLVATSMRTPYSKGLCVTIEDMMANEGVQTLSEAMARYPQTFDAYEINMVRTGDSTGKLKEVLDILAEHTLKWLALRSKIKKAVTYPAIMLFATVLIGSFLVMKVIPDILSSFSTLGVVMPPAVTILAAVTSWLNQYWYIPISAVIAMIAALVVFWKPISKQHFFQRAIVKVPIVGDLISKTAIAQSLAAFGMFMRSGKTDIDSLPVVVDLATNIVFKDYFSTILASVKEGYDIGTSFMRAKTIIGRKEGMIIASQMKLAVSSGAVEDTLELMIGERERIVADYADQLPELLNPILISIIIGGGTLLIIPVFMALFAVVSGIQ
jgi:type IV pilus assembly protein PilC